MEHRGITGESKGWLSSGHRSVVKLQLSIWSMHAGSKRSSIHHSARASLMPPERLPVRREAALAVGSQCWPAPGRGRARGTPSSPTCRDGGCTDYSPSALINLTPSSVLIQIILWEACQAC